MAIESVTMTSVYPHQELSGELDDQTMSQLQLVPSAVLLVRVNKVRTIIIPLSLTTQAIATEL